MMHFEARSKPLPACPSALEIAWDIVLRSKDSVLILRNDVGVKVDRWCCLLLASVQRLNLGRYIESLFNMAIFPALKFNEFCVTTYGSKEFSEPKCAKSLQWPSGSFQTAQPC